MIDQCQLGAPAVVSGPHFSSASQYFFDTIDGMDPVELNGDSKFSLEESEHTSYTAYEPTSGALVFNAKKVQINFLVEPVPQIDIFADIKQPIAEFQYRK